MKITAFLMIIAMFLGISGCSTSKNNFEIKEENAMELYGCSAFELEDNLTAEDVTKLYKEEAEKQTGLLP